jgi:hypothetical protein
MPPARIEVWTIGGHHTLFGPEPSAMSRDDDMPDDPLPDLYNPEAWCTEESTAMRQEETSEQWMMRLLMTADAHGDHDFVNRVEQAIAGRVLMVGQPIAEA